MLIRVETVCAGFAIFGNCVVVLWYIFFTMHASTYIVPFIVILLLLMTNE